MKAVFYSHRGTLRQKNEDAILAAGCIVSEAQMEVPAIVLSDCNNSLFVVADGMGGYEGGALAARMLLLSLLDRLGGDDAVDEGLLRNIFREVTEQMRKTAETNMSLGGMGTTIAGLAVREGEANIFNCGDCRVYRFRGGYLDKLSHDHSVVQRLVDSGEISEDEMRKHPRKNMVTSAVKADSGINGVSVFFRKYATVTGEKFFLCSDGVWETLALEELEECLRDEDMVKGCDSLRRRLLDSDCQDNIAFVFAEI